MEYNNYPLLEKDFYQWCSNNCLNIQSKGDHIFSCGDMTFLLLEEKEGNVCDCEYHFILNDYEKKQLKSVDAVAYKWGTRFCYTKVSVMEQPDNDNVKDFKYIGETTLNKPGLPFLGVHGQYEILNGSRNYNDWASKAKFLGISTLGICEKNTLAGTMSFQQSCAKVDIKSVLGETITINNGNDLFCEGKIFALSADGWKNVLQINAEINVINPSPFVTESRLLELGKDVAFVFDPLNFPYNEDSIKAYQKAFSLCYFKLDSVQYENDKTDKTFLEETQKYLNNELGLKPILLCDAYYLDSTDYEIKKDLNLVSGIKSVISHNQYFKADDENLILLSEMFKDEDFDKVLEAMESLKEFDNQSNFSIPTGHFKLPQYKMTEEEKKKYGDTDTMFDSLVMDGWERLKMSELPNVDVYLDRLQEEIDVIRTGGYIDYFLILHDIIGWCKRNDILVGVARGSAAGCLVAFLLDITKIDPIKYGLLFERFLNRGRIFKTYDYEVIKVQLNDNLCIELEPKEKVVIFRESKEKTVSAKDLQENDTIISLKSGNLEEMLQGAAEAF